MKRDSITLAVPSNNSYIVHTYKKPVLNIRNKRARAHTHTHAQQLCTKLFVVEESHQAGTEE